VVSTPALCCKLCLAAQVERRLFGKWERIRCGLTGRLVARDATCTAPVELLAKLKSQISHEIPRRAAQ